MDMIETACRLSEEPHTYWIDQLNNHDTIAGYCSLADSGLKYLSTDLYKRG
jgi:hypothetical protein